MLKGYKTVIFNVIMGLIMMIRALNPDAEVPGDESVNAAIDALDVTLTALWGIGNLILRAITTSPVFKKEETR